MAGSTHHTPVGKDVPVDLSPDVGVTFDEVVKGGETTLDQVLLPQALPKGFRAATGAPCHKITTTASHIQSFRVKLPVPVADAKSNVRMLVLDHPFEEWIDITNGKVQHTPNPGYHIMGWFPKNSCFVVAVAPSGYVPKHIDVSAVGPPHGDVGPPLPLTAFLKDGGNLIADPSAVLKLYVAKLSGVLLGPISQQLSPSPFQWNPESQRYQLDLNTSKLTSGRWQVMAVGELAYGDTKIELT